MTEPTPNAIRRAHPRHDLDDLLTHAVRLPIVATLADVDRAEFALVRDSVEITDPMPSKQVALLEQAGCVGVDKGRGARTWLSLTPDGRAAHRRHIRALQAIAGLTYDDSDDYPGSTRNRAERPFKGSGGRPRRRHSWRPAAWVRPRDRRCGWLSPG
ncbi:hypothetical protein Psi02_57100 [Planotetraspora silvatica]|uniref:Winged helix DNA-binding domain-containing protein n=1 Tax=Planotetraspora silvatica TaxID=234614 RepID=A0A8J3URG0_9ACTN|nr:transcriptional regulator [Planotetraspora silvatica]GII49286.1 hypothetical protein Psi02_57100 [Planotetraspora silvatica]